MAFSFSLSVLVVALLISALISPAQSDDLVGFESVTDEGLATAQRKQPQPGQDPHDQREGSYDEVKILYDEKVPETNATHHQNSQHNIPTEEEIRLEYERELKARQAEARRQQKLREKRVESVNAVKHAIHASTTDRCDWKTNPVAVLKGEVCGSHYKVLGMNRRSEEFNKSQVKKAFRRMSLSLHPDKNPTEDAQKAFEILQNAYDCILDDECKESYDEQLAALEERIYWEREGIKHAIMTKSMSILKQAHYYISIAANHVYQIGMNFWNICGGWKITVFDEEYPVGRPVAIAVLLWRGQFLLKLHAIAYLVVRVNYEIAKAKGWL